ncbi:MAG: hypothetical protein A2Z08_03165 [Deltaproteobacteria bacterium RBG_16_54_11]|nr:MAG: hypothetical protein A2Z08_03165 [Deltaproteobacteria bacterium RBG_16_54_11]
MKELFQLLSKYNAQTNAEMIGVLEKLPAEQITKDVGSFYGSILGLLNHILVSDVFGIKRFFKQYPELEQTRAKLPTFRMEGWKDIIWPSLAVLKPIRTAVDEAIQQACELLTEQQYASILEYKNWDGKTIQKPSWLVLLHMFNHQTHNRGQIAVILDQMGVDNDYSGMIEKF